MVAHKDWFIEKVTKHSSVLLIFLVTFSINQSLCSRVDSDSNFTEWFTTHLFSSSEYTYVHVIILEIVGVSKPWVLF